MKVQILQLIEGAQAARGLTVVIDVFRAFTVEAWLMHNGTQKLLPVGEVETALEYRDAHPGTILVGEREGAIIPGFDFGNSPSQIEKEDFTGKTVVHTTSAGTQGVVNATGADMILAGSLTTAAAIARYIKQVGAETVSLVCMGLAGVRPTDEDTLCARYIKSILEDTPLDLAGEIEKLKVTDGAKFFDPAQQSMFPEPDFWLSVQADRFDFVLKVELDEETGLHSVRKIHVP